VDGGIGLAGAGAGRRSVTADGEDLRGLTTEQTRPELSDLDLLSVEQLVSLMCADVRRVPEAVGAAEEQIARAVDGVAAALARDGRLIYVGAGTAGRIGLLDAAEAGPTFGAPHGQVVGVLAGGGGAFDVPVENAEDDRAGGTAAIAGLAVGPADAVVGIAASGRTPFVLGAIEAAHAAGATTVGVVCNEGTPLAELADIPIEVLVGPEIVAGSTRLNAGTAQKVVLNIISTAAMVQLGKTYGGLMVDLRATNEKLRDRATRIVAEIAGVSPGRAREALEQCDWRAKSAAAMLVGETDPTAARLVLERHDGRLRPALEELGARSPGPGPGTRRLGVAAAFIGGALVKGDVSISDGAISAVGLAGPGRGIAIPGLVDAQVNGYAGVDLLSADADEVAALGAALLRDGVAAYQPTLISSGEAETVAALQRIAQAQARDAHGARIVGVHLEGPFLAPGRAGAHPAEHLRAPDRALLARLLDAGPVTAVTLAPELPGALELVELCVHRNVAVWLGHSEASAKEARRAFAAGAQAVTHLFNAMPAVSAREPGLAGAALATPGIALQLIGDAVHVSDELLRVAFSAAAGRCSLVSDAVAASGLPDGDYRLGDAAIQVSGGVSRLANGALAGSTARLADGLAHLGSLGLDQADAIAAVTERPGRLVGDGGRLEPGGRADLAVVDDELALDQVFAGGRRLEDART
jgi:N-acetylglucosamine-6-phosphate deacetylase